MTLKEFVSDTLIQIVDGVAKAKTTNNNIAPRVTHQSGVPVVQRIASHPTAFLVGFDVAVTVSKTTDTQAKGGVAIHVFEAGAQRTSGSEESTVSRIKFEVPVEYP
jgi:hypothetical protein